MKFLIVTLSALLLAFPAFAAEVAPDVQVKLQNAMQSHLDGVSDDGAYTYLTPAAATRTLYPANTHPMVLAYGDDFFVCSDMVDEAGKSFTADFLVRQIGGDYRVVQMMVDQREVVKKAMGMGQ